MVIVAGILAQIVARQFAGRPRFVKWMTQQIVLGDGCFHLLEELSGIHDGLRTSVMTDYYTDDLAARQVIGIIPSMTC
jgi:hypothetical protein